MIGERHRLYRVQVAFTQIVNQNYYNTERGICKMGFSPKRLKALAQGKVEYCIYEGPVCVFRDKSFMVTVQMADTLSKTNPNVEYTMKVEEIC